MAASDRIVVRQHSLHFQPFLDTADAPKRVLGLTDTSVPMADVFISYARADRTRVEPLVQAIEAEGFSCLLYTSPSPRDPKTSRMPSSA